MLTPSPDLPIALRPEDAPDLAAINTFLSMEASEIGPVLSVTRFPGGFSNLTYCLQTAEKEYVLRRPPLGAAIQSAHDMGREYRVLHLLKPHYAKIPTPVAFCDNADLIGAPFYIMERLEGVILRAHNTPGMQLEPDLLRRISEALIDNLVVLHAIDIEKTGLAQLGKPEAYVQRQVDGWIKRYYNAETDNIPAMNALAEWMPAHLPAGQAPTLLHNDYKHDNVLLDPNNLTQIRGVLDWEMATVGDPLMDLGATLAYWIEAGDPEMMRTYNLTWLPGNLTRREVIERYTEKSGRDVKDIRFYYVFGMFKNAVIGQQIYARWKKGQAQDPRFGKLIEMVRVLGEMGVRALEKPIFV